MQISLTEVGAVVKLSGTINFVEQFIKHERSPAGLGVLWRPTAGRRYLRPIRSGKLSLDLWSTSNKCYNLITELSKNIDTNYIKD